MRTLIYFSLITLLFACQSEKPDPVFGTAQLPTQSFTIINNQATKLTTAGGIIIEIPAQSFDQEEVSITVKEALSLLDIIKGNLSTITNDGQLLESKGMFEIRATDAEGNALSLKKEIKITIPNAGLDEGYQIYAGETDAKGNIAWSVEKELAEPENLARFVNGRQLFQNNCSACHNGGDLSADLTGPALGNIQLYRDSVWLVEATRDMNKLIASGDITANCLYRLWSKTVMVSFSQFTDKEVEDIYIFIANESINQGIPSDWGNYVVCDTIEGGSFQVTRSNGRLDTLMINAEGFGQQWINDNGDTISMESYYLTNQILQVNQLGWWNIDRLYQEDNARETNLLVNIPDAPSFTKVKMVFVERNIFLNANFRRGDLFSFNYSEFSERVKLPVGEKVIIIATNTVDQQMQLGTKSMTTGEQKVIDVLMKNLSKEELEEELRTLVD